MNKIMYISELSVINFRSIEKETFLFNPYSILIGKNNAGKSNIIDALRLLLEGTKKDFTARDFHNSDEDIIFEAKIENAEHFLDLSSEPHKGKIKEDIDEEGCLKVRRVIKSGLDVDKLRVFDLKKGDYGLKTGIENSLKQLLPEVIFIEAVKNPSIEAQGKPTVTLGKIIRQILDRVQKETSEKIEKAFKDANVLLNVVEKKINGKSEEIDNRTEDIKNIESKIKRNLQTVFGDVDVRLKIDFPEVPELLANSRIELFDSGVWTPPELKGQGVQRALYVALLRSLADQLRESDIKEASVKRPFMLLVEEPEIFLHPSVLETMRSAVENISKTNQVVISTHSPNIVSRKTFSNVILIRKLPKQDKKGKTIKLNKNAVKLDEKHEKRICELLGYNRSSKFLFSDKVIVVEGPSDVAYYEALIEKWAGQSLDSLNLAVIESCDKSIAFDCSELLREIGLDAICVLDVDFIWNGAGSFCKKGDYSKFLDGFWKKAKEAGIIKEEKLTDKAKAGELLETDFKKERDDILTQLKERKIWVLSNGEIEDYINSGKGEYMKIAKRIRDGSQKIKDEKDLQQIFKEGVNLQII